MVHFSDYVPNLCLPVGLGGGHDAGLPTGLLFGPGLAVSFLVLALAVLVLR